MPKPRLKIEYCTDKEQYVVAREWNNEYNEGWGDTIPEAIKDFLYWEKELMETLLQCSKCGSDKLGPEVEDDCGLTGFFHCCNCGSTKFIREPDNSNFSYKKLDHD